MARLLVAMLLCSTRAGAQEVELLAPYRSARTIEACRLAWKQTHAEGLPTAYLRGLSQEAATCTRRVMNVEVDKLLVPLKKSNPPLFQRGMDAQRFFNEAVKGYCGRWNAWYRDCCSTCSYTELPACEMAFHAGRVTQVQTRAVPVDEHPATRQRTSDFAAYSREWCAFLSEQKVPVDDTCGARVLRDVEAHQPDDGAPLHCK